MNEYEQQSSPEKLLWCQVIVQALDDAVYFRVKEKTRMQEYDARIVKAWIDTSDFYQICNMVGIHPASARRTFQKVLDGGREEYERIRTLLANSTGFKRKDRELI
jgi:hypothetical protein